MRSSSFLQKYKRLDTPSVARFFTFGCYHHKHLFRDPHLCHLFLHHLDQKREAAPFEIWAYVVMPDHVHLLLFAEEPISLRKQVSQVKRASAHDMLVFLKSSNPEKLESLWGRDHGKDVLRFWQYGGGYDRDLWTPKAIHDAIRYIHNNPVRNGQVELPENYPWSSANNWLTGSDEPIRINPISYKS